MIKDQVQTREPFSKIEELESNKRYIMIGNENKIQLEKRERREKKAISQEHSKEEKNLNSGRSNKEKKVEMEGLSMNLKAFNKKEEEKKEEKSKILLILRRSYTFIDNRCEFKTWRKEEDLCIRL